MKNTNETSNGAGWSEISVGAIILIVWMVVMFMLFAGSAKGQTNVMSVYDFSGYGTDNHFTTVSGYPHIGDDDPYFWYSYQSVYGQYIEVRTAVELPKVSAYYSLSLQYVASHQIQVYAVSTSGAKKLIGTLQPVIGWPETVDLPFYAKKLERIEFTTASTAEVKIFSFDQFFLTQMWTPTMIAVIQRELVTGWKEAKQ